MGRARMIIGIAILALVLAYGVLFVVPSRTDGARVLGVQFTPAHATYLGLDWRETYRAVLDDLRVRTLRLGAYWTDVEPEDGTFAFTDLDWVLDEAHARGATVTLAVGRRLPRWPECHVPAWARALPEEVQQARVEAYVRAVVERYRAHPALRMWQVENEPFLRYFGECSKSDAAHLAREIAIVRELDPGHAVLITDSGELSFWRRTARFGDRFGTTMYRVVWNRTFGYFTYDWVLPPSVYRLKAWFAGVPRDKMIIAELQAEPWIPSGHLAETPLAEQRRSMDAARFARHLAFARATGFPEVYLWGAEYWYWLRAQGDGSMWDAARAAFAERE